MTYKPLEMHSHSQNIFAPHINNVPPCAAGVLPGAGGAVPPRPPATASGSSARQSTHSPAAAAAGSTMWAPARPGPSWSVR